MAFDAPSRQECTAERATSNTPMQALTLLNDPTYVESGACLCWRGFLVKAVNPLLTVSTGRTSGLLSRMPQPQELEIITNLYEKAPSRVHRQSQRGWCA